MPSYLPQFTIRLSKAVLYKIRYIAEQNERSANKEIAVLVKKHIVDYEKENGEIEVPAEELS